MKNLPIGEFCMILQHAGFVVHQLKIDKCSNNFKHSDELHQWFQTWSSHKDCLPLRKQDLFLNEAVESYINHHDYSLNDSFPYYEYLLEVICEKPVVPINQTSQYKFGNVNFSRAEASVLKHFLMGKSAKEIALIKSISPKTVEFHLSKIKEKLSCRLRSEIFQLAYRDGFVRLIYDQTL